MTLLVSVEGCDGAGKSKHVGALAQALHDAGIVADTWEHDAPRDVVAGDPWSVGLHYASQRARLARHIRKGYSGSIEVLVIDRWLWSTHVAAHTTLRGPSVHGALLSLARAERFALPHEHTILLTAPVEVIAARLRARPEEVPDNLARAQGHYVALAVAHGWPVVNTDRDAAEVTRDLVAIVRRLLTAQGVCPTTEGL